MLSPPQHFFWQDRPNKYETGMVKLYECLWLLYPVATLIIFRKINQTLKKECSAVDGKGGAVLANHKNKKVVSQ